MDVTRRKPRMRHATAGVRGESRRIGPVNTTFQAASQLMSGWETILGRVLRIRGLVTGLALVSGVSASAFAQTPTIPQTGRAAVLLPPRVTDPSEVPLVARGAFDDLPTSPLATSPIPRSGTSAPVPGPLTLPAGGVPPSGPAWLRGADPNVIPAGAGIASPTGNQVNPIPATPTGDEPSLVSRGLNKLKGMVGTGSPASGEVSLTGQPTGVRGPTDPYAPLQGTGANGAPVLAGPPAWYWYGWGGPTPGTNAYAPNGQYPRGSSAWHTVTKATPGAFPVPVMNPYRPAPGNEPPAYTAASAPGVQPQTGRVPTGGVGTSISPRTASGQGYSSPPAMNPPPPQVSRLNPPPPPPTPVALPSKFTPATVGTDAPRLIPQVPPPTLPGFTPPTPETRLPVPPALTPPTPEVQVPIVTVPQPSMGIPTLATPPIMIPTAILPLQPTPVPESGPVVATIPVPSPAIVLPQIKPSHNEPEPKRPAIVSHTAEGSILTTTKPAVPVTPSAPAALPGSVTDEVRWQSAPDKAVPLPPGTWVPAGVTPRSPTPPASEDVWQQPGATNTTNRQPIARGQMADPGPQTDPVADLIQAICRSRAAEVDIRWTGSKKLGVCFEVRGEADARRLVRDICARPELAPLQIDFCVLVK